MVGNVRERGREALRAELADAAANFCADNGFADSTVDQIAQAIGISRATFFRYFGSKEDAVVTSARLQRRSLGDQLRRIELPADSTALTAVRGALESTVAAARANPSRARSRVAMIRENPTLRARLAADRADQSRDLAEALEDLMDDPVSAQAAAVTAMAALELGWSLWVGDDGSDLGEQFDRAFLLVAKAPEVKLSPERLAAAR